MKRIFAIAWLCILATNSWSQQLLYEPFNYTPDPVNGLHVQSGNVWVRINSGDSILVDNGSLTYSGLQSSTGNKVKFDGTGSDNYTDYTSQTTGSVYFSFILNVSSLGTLGTTGGYFTGFIQSGSTSLFGATVWTRQSATAGMFNVGISTRSNSTVSWLATDLTPGTPCFIVAAYDFVTGSANDVCRIWLNTGAIGGAEPTADATSVPGTDLSSVARLFLRQDNTTNTPFIELDEMRVGTTWQSVTPGSAATPTLTANPTTIPDFGNVNVGSNSTSQSFNLSGANLTGAPGNITVTSPSTDFQVSNDNSTWAASTTIAYSSATLPSTPVYVRFTPQSAGFKSGNVTISGGGATTINVAVSGTGVVPPPVLNANPTTIPDFGNVIVGTNSTSQSFDLSGTNLTGAPGDITITAPSTDFQVSNDNSTWGPSTTIPYSSATLPTTAVYVRFTPQSTGFKSGNVSISGGGATTITVAVSGTGVVPPPVLSANPTTLPDFGNVIVGNNSTSQSFDLSGTNLTGAPGTITITAPSTDFQVSNDNSTWGPSTTIPYSSATLPTTAVYVRFTPQSTGFKSGNVTISGGGATTINVAVSGTGVNPTPTLIANPTTIPDFGNVNVGTNSTSQSFNLSGANLTGGPGTITVTAPSTDFQVSNDNSTWGSSTTIPYSSATLPTTTVYVRFTPQSAGFKSGNVSISGGGASTITVAVSGTGIIPPPVLTANPTTLPSFGNIPVGANSTSQSFTLSGADLIGAPGTITITAPSTDFQVSNDNSTWGPNTTVPYSSATLSSTPVYVRFTPQSAGPHSGNVSISGGGATASVAVSGTGVIPTLTTTALTAFGNVCINTIAGPNSFTIDGTNLTSANVTVGPLAGFAFSTTSGGTYTASLSLTQGGGTYSQQIFVQFSPIAVQSYNGNIPVGGGGAATANVAASGAGVNTAPSITTGAASAITFNSATAAGTITANGCTAITSYGIEYSTTNGFPNGTGTQVASGNLSGGNFSSNLTGLAPNTVYYYKAYATNSGGTTYGTQQSFTTLPLPVTLSATTLTAFGNVCINITAGPNSFTITGSNLNNTNINVGPLAGYTFATSAGGTYSASLSLSQPGGAYSQQIFVRFTPTAVQSYNGNIPVSGGGATAINVAASGSGINTPATVTTGSASNITTQSATLAGSIDATGCSSVTTYGIEYSGINGFANGSGTQVASNNLSGNNFSASLTGLVQGTTYYYKAYAVNNGGTAYGAQQSFTVLSIADGFKLYPVPAERGSMVRITMNDLTPGNYSLIFINSEGQLVYQKNIHIQANFINQEILIPATLGPGVYTVQLIHNTSVLATKNILVL